MRFFYDHLRHLVCHPYSVTNLHAMAASLDIKRCWFHRSHFAHYDVPRRDVGRIANLAEKVSPRELLRIIKGGAPP